MPKIIRFGFALTMVASSVIFAATARVPKGATAQVLAADHPFERGAVKRRVLSVPSRTILNRYRLHGYQRIRVTVASREGRIAAVADKLASLGGAVEFEAQDVDYLRGTIPVEQALVFSADPDVVDVDFGNQTSPAGVGFLFPDADRPPSSGVHVQNHNSGGRAAQVRPAPLNELTPENAIFPTALVGAPQFVRANPTYDGRGVVVAVVDGVVGDLGHPMLQTARLLDGSITTKTIDILDPETEPESVDPEGARHVRCGFVELREVETDRTGKFLANDRMYTAPSVGRYRFGILLGEREARACDAPLDRSLGVLWDDNRDLVWIDTDGDLDFRNELAIKSFSWRQETVRVRSGPQSLSDGVPLAVRTNTTNRTLRIYVGNNAHATGVASIAVGTSLLGSAATGTAPSSGLIYVVPSEDSFVESFLFAARDPRVDLITCSIGPDIGSWVDGVQNLILERIIQRYQKPVFLAAGDSGPLAASVGWQSAATNAFAIGTYSDQRTEETHRQSLFRNDEQEYVNGISNSGPSGLGALKPDLLAPSLTAWAKPCFNGAALMNSNTDSMQAGHCAGIGSGMSSFATPMAAGVAALLISAAKQAHVPYDLQRIRYALMASAHILPKWPIERQGGGLIQVQGAWGELLKLATKEPVQILSAATIGTTDVSSGRLPGYGVSVFEWEGWHPGDDGDRNLFLYRTNGPTSAIKYRIELLENDGTFAAANDDVTLPLRTPIAVRIHVHPLTNGMHASILRLFDATTRELTAQYGIYIVAADALQAARHFFITRSGSVSRNRSSSVFVDVPSNALLLDLAVHLDSGAARLRVWRPEWYETQGFQYPTNILFDPVTGMYPNDTSDSTMLVPAPTPGVWQFLLDDGGVYGDDELGGFGSQSSELKETRYTLTARVVVADVPPAELVARDRLDGEESAGVLFEEGILEDASRPSFYRFEVRQDVSELSVSLIDAEDAKNTDRPELYLYHCIGDHCRLWSHRSGAEPRSVTVRTPAVGTWVAAAETIILRPHSGTRLQVLEATAHFAPGQSPMLERSGVEFPSIAHAIDPRAFKQVSITEYFDRAAELREILSPLNQVQFYWSAFRPAPLLRTVEPPGDGARRNDDYSDVRAPIGR